MIIKNVIKTKDNFVLLKIFLTAIFLDIKKYVKRMMELIVLTNLMVIVKDGIIHKMEQMSIKVQLQTGKLDHIVIQIMDKNAHKFF
jgi:hypothetical protein